MFTRLSGAFAVVLALCFGSALAAEQADKPVITDTIQSQFDALANDDFAQAFTYASPLIQQLFGSPQNFGMMVTQSYPMVRRAEDVQFLDLRSIGGSLYQKVQVRDVKGEIFIFDYQMIQSENGWKINGVQLVTSSGVSA
ncbi:DUF4864 domain-containing protein [Planktotalea sp.]|uniref:DUF4864 domain-containing protein n=1 Tax=Planktotalea sp. TaxID=2029877 RepID=UPI0025E29B7D|nr:DUF4864 domain-containing protein [Planktotalea sp.]